MDLSIISECFVDTNLIETLVPPTGRGYNHQKGCGTVGLKMKTSLKDEFALGIIDKDKKELDYLKEFNQVLNEGALVLHKHKTKPHYMIQIQPAVEKFILNAAFSVGISVEEFDLSSDLKELINISKTEQSKKDPRFKKLFKALESAGATDFIILKKWVEHLKNNPYSADLEALKEN